MSAALAPLFFALSEQWSAEDAHVCMGLKKPTWLLVFCFSPVTQPLL